MEKRDSNCQ